MLRPTNAVARIDGNQLDAFMGDDVAGVGDVNGDGLSNVIKGARTFTRAIADDAVSNGSVRLGGEGITCLFTASAAAK
ncbi:MAG: hypothetical protein ABF290_15520 [Thiogranum sp.]